MTDPLSVLRELVEVQDLKKSFAQAGTHAKKFPTDDNYAVMDKLGTDIMVRGEAAWSAARAMVASPPEGVMLTDEEIADIAREHFGEPAEEWGAKTLNARWLEEIGIPFARAVLSAVKATTGYGLPGGYVNAARINASDMPHTVVEKLNAAALAQPSPSVSAALAGGASPNEKAVSAADELMKRTVYELSQSEKDAAVAAFQRVHEDQPNWPNPADRAWLEGFAAGRVSCSAAVSAAVGSPVLQQGTEGGA